MLVCTQWPLVVAILLGGEALSLYVYFVVAPSGDLLVVGRADTYSL
jgi:hypothetical protein